MKTEVTLILIFTFINLSFCDEVCSGKSTGVTKKSDCTDISLTSSEKKTGANSCCYVTYKDDGEDVKECMALPKKYASDYKETLEGFEYTDVNVECNSKWLNFSMLLIGLFALLF